MRSFLPAIGRPHTVGLCAAVVIAVACHVQGAANWADGRNIDTIVCRANFSLKEYEGLLDELARLRGDIRQQLQLPESNELIEIYLFSDEATYEAYLKKYFPKIPYHRALFIKNNGPGRVFAFCGKQLEVDIRHEMTHAVLHAALPSVPLWLDEGLAKYYEQSAENRVYDNPYFSGLKWRVRFGSIPKLDELEKKTAINDMGESQYRDAFAWVHFLVNGPPAARNELIAYLEDLGNGNTGKLSSRLEHRWANPPQQLALHLRNWKKPR